MFQKTFPILIMISGTVTFCGGSHKYSDLFGAEFKNPLLKFQYLLNSVILRTSAISFHICNSFCLSPLFLTLCVCLLLTLCMCVCVHMCTRECRGQRTSSGVILKNIIYSLSLAWDHQLKQIAWPPNLGIFLSPLSQC